LQKYTDEQKELRRWRTRLQEKRVHLLEDLKDSTLTPVQFTDISSRPAQLEVEIAED